jgi:hypothetical protein
MLAYLDNTCGKEADEELKDEWYCYMLEPTISVEIKVEFSVDRRFKTNNSPIKCPSITQDACVMQNDLKNSKTASCSLDGEMSQVVSHHFVNLKPNLLGSYSVILVHEFTLTSRNASIRTRGSWRGTCSYHSSILQSQPRSQWPVTQPNIRFVQTINSQEKMT